MDKKDVKEGDRIIIEKDCAEFERMFLYQDKNGFAIYVEEPLENIYLEGNPNYYVSVAKDWRPKSQKKYVPFTNEDDLLGMKIKNKFQKGPTIYKYIIIKQCDNGVATSWNDSITYENLLNNYMFLDGSPCGKLKE
jgi:hypothetical protein